MSKRKHFFVSIIAVGFILIVAGCGSTKGNETTGKENDQDASTDVITLKAAHYFEPTHPWNKGLEYFAKKTKELTDGKVQIEIFNNGVLGSETDMLQSLREGTLDFAVTDPSAGSSFSQELDFFALPFLFNSYSHWEKTLDGAPGEKYAQIISEKADLQILGYWGGSARNVLSTDNPVKSIDDLSGFKLRLVQSPLKVDVWKAVGTIPTPIDYLETYSALQSGTVDGMENESVAVKSMKFYEPAPYITRTEHEFTVRPLFMSKITMEGLSEELQEAIITAAEEATKYERKVEKEATKEAERVMEEEFDVKFYSIDKEPFRKITEPVLKKYAKEMELTDLFNEIRQNK